MVNDQYDYLKYIDPFQLQKALDILGVSSGGTNLSIENKTANTLDVASDTGLNATIPEATISEAGLLGAVDKVKIDGLTDLQLATQQQVLESSKTTAISPFELFRATMRSSFHIKNTMVGAAIVLAAGDSYNLLTTMVTASETTLGNLDIDGNSTVPVFYTTDPVYNANGNDGSVQLKILDDVQNIFIFPSAKNTYGDGTYVNYITYFFRITESVDFSSVNNATTKTSVRMRRFFDDSIITTESTVQSDFVAEAGVENTTVFETFTGSSSLAAAELDPFYTGMYVDRINDINSTGTVTEQNATIIIWRQ